MKLSRYVVVLIVLAVLSPFMFILAFLGLFGGTASASCTPNAPVGVSPANVQLGDSANLSSEQLADAQTIVGVAVSRKLTARDALVALMVGLQESGLRNLPYGDSDSLGIFQQRPSQGWGTPEQILNPVYATNKFYDHLVALQNRQDMSLLDIALAVQNPSRTAYQTFMSNQSLALKLLGKYDANVPADIAQTVSYDVACAAGGAGNAVLEVAIQAAMSQIGVPYHWGDEEVGSGFDCSGLMQWAFDRAGIHLPRVSSQQYQVGTHVPANQLQRGDLVFWASDTSNPATVEHVALYLGNGQIISAPHTGAFVRTEPMYYDGFIGGTRLAAPSATVPSTQLGWQLPVASSDYTRLIPSSSDLEFAAPAGTEVVAASNGIVASSGTNRTDGRYVIIRHEGGVQTEYAHLRAGTSDLKSGRSVRLGQVIGSVGSTGTGIGDRLIFRIREQGSLVDPVQFLREHGVRP